MKSESVNLQHRPFMTPIWLSVIAVFIGFSLAVFGIWVWGTADSTTVIVIRHAEKDTSDPVDPALSAAGEARAALLARIFGDPNGPGLIEAIYVSPTQRNRLTAAPLAARLRLVPIVAPADDPAELAHRALREHRGGRILIVGHIDTVPQIVAALSGKSDIPKIADQDYGIMYIVSVPRIGHANLLRLNY